MRLCEFEGCDVQEDLADMIRGPNGEWYCGTHAGTLGITRKEEEDRRPIIRECFALVERIAAMDCDCDCGEPDSEAFCSPECYCNECDARRLTQKIGGDS